MTKKSLSQKWHSVITRLSYLPKALQLVWNACAYWTIAWAILLIVAGLLPAANVYLTRWLVNALVTVTGKGIAWASIQPVILPAKLMAGVLLLNEIVQNLNEWVRTAQSELLKDYISRLVHHKSYTVDYAFYELPEYYDRLSRATADAGEESLSLLENLGGVLQNSITLVAIVVLLIPYGWWLPIGLVISTLPAFFVLLRLNQRYYRWWERVTTQRRRLRYYELLLTHSTSAAEIRLFNVGSYFQSLYQQLRAQLRQERIEIAKEQALGRLISAFIALLLSSIILLWIARQVLLGTLTLGDLALFYQAFNRGQGAMKTILNDFGDIYNNSLFLSNLFEFLNLSSQILDPYAPKAVPLPLHHQIQFHNVTFRYPGSDQPVLSNFNLVLPVGKVIAIVGDNGAGKSTLVKLLCRLYDPEDGRIELDGIDLRDLAIADLHRLLTVLFQSPIPYHLTAAENIALGDLSLVPTQAEIETAAKEAGIHETIQHLPQGYDTPLGKWFFDGVELSGGEWQRLALARSFLRQAQIIILDEPTSAMDPWAEADWLTRFRTLAQGRTAIVITHRFTLAKQADLIYVMRQGQIIESGSHETLLAQDGFYARSWQTQISS